MLGGVSGKTYFGKKYALLKNFFQFFTENEICDIINMLILG
jgi:hypothetical protein